MNKMRYKIINGYAPTKAHAGDAGWDLKSPVDMVIRANGSAFIPLGIAVEIPGGCYGAIESRSGLAKRCIQCHRGIIDSNYRGEIGVQVYNHGEYDYHIQAGDRICQLIIHKYEHVAIGQVSELSESNRGANGFGSSGR